MTSTPAPDLAKPWNRATLALALLAVDPGLGGLHVRARFGPVLSAFRDEAAAVLGAPVTLFPAMSDDQLFGGLDLSATLAQGRIVQQSGLLARPGPRVLAMAERCPQAMAARLAQSLDGPGDAPLILLDEGATDDEIAPQALRERLAFAVDLEGLHQAEAMPGSLDLDAISAARALLPAVTDDAEIAAQVVDLCEQLGITSLRAPLFAMRAARALAALASRDETDATDLEAAVMLTLLHRATQVPEDSTEPPADTPDQPEETPPDAQTSETDMPPDDMILAAVLAQLPADVLEQAARRNQRQGRGTGSGARRRGNRRGRPLPARPGRLDGRAQLDLVATLRAAAPWQTARRGDKPKRLRIHARDIHVKRFETLSDRLLIFAVDASGSAALARLAEAKGAVELLLAQAYSRRDHVGLVSFRGAGAEVLLPPTRSLVQAKRRLAGLPGGGGTPLAAGLRQAGEMAGLARQKGHTPTLILLTDGRANIGLDGQPGRAQAGSDATRIATGLRADGVEALVIDTGPRAEPALRALADVMEAHYLALPRADSARLSQAVSANLQA